MYAMFPSLEYKWNWCVKVSGEPLKSKEALFSLFPAEYETDTCVHDLSRVPLCNPMACSLSASSVHGILQARMLEWVSISFSRRSPQPKDWTQISCIGRWVLYYWATRAAQESSCCCCCCKVASVVSDSVQPDRWQPTRLPHPWNSPGKNTGVGCHFLLQCMKVRSESEVAHSCPTLSDPTDCSPPGSSIHGIFQARVLEWGAIAFSKESS